MEEQAAFSPWTLWEKRNLLWDKQGIYLWARFTQDMPSATLPANPLQKEVIYIGETCKGEGCFRKRWYLFDKGLAHPEKVGANPKRYFRAKRYIEHFDTDRLSLYIATLTSNALMKAYLGLSSYEFLDIKAIPPDDLESFWDENSDLLVRYMERSLILFVCSSNGGQTCYKQRLIL